MTIKELKALALKGGKQCELALKERQQNDILSKGFYSKNQLHNLQGPLKNKTVESLAQKTGECTIRGTNE